MFKSDWYIRILVVIGIIIFSLSFLLSGLTNLSINNVISKAFSATTMVLIFHCIFEKYLWKYKKLRPLIVKVPNLHGTWKGHLRSSWEDPNTQTKIDTIPVTVHIRQSFTTVSVEIHTAKMVSTSYIAGFRTDTDTGIQELCYTYSSKSHITSRETNPWHDGTAKLTIYEGSDISLSGEYWTSRKTVGTLSLTRISTSIERTSPLSDTVTSQATF